MKARISILLVLSSFIWTVNSMAAEAIVTCDGVKFLADENPSKYEVVNTSFSIFNNGSVEMSIDGDAVNGFEVVKTLNELSQDNLEQTVEILRIYGVSNLAPSNVVSRTEYLMKKKADMYSSVDTWTSAVVVALDGGKSYVLTMVGASYGLCVNSNVE